MLKDLIKVAALKAADQSRREGDLAKLRAALWLARRAADIKPLERRSIYADFVGCVHVGRNNREASLRAHEVNCTYA